MFRSLPSAGTKDSDMLTASSLQMPLMVGLPPANCAGIKTFFPAPPLPIFWGSRFARTPLWWDFSRRSCAMPSSAGHRRSGHLVTLSSKKSRDIHNSLALSPFSVSAAVCDFLDEWFIIARDCQGCSDSEGLAEAAAVVASRDRRVLFEACTLRFGGFGRRAKDGRGLAPQRGDRQLNTGDTRFTLFFC